jgi:hypothetical protein
MRLGTVANPHDDGRHRQASKAALRKSKPDLEGEQSLYRSRQLEPQAQLVRNFGAERVPRDALHLDALEGRRLSPHLLLQLVLQLQQEVSL